MRYIKCNDSLYLLSFFILFNCICKGLEKNQLLLNSLNDFVFKCRYMGQGLSSLNSENTFQEHLFSNIWQNKPFVLMAELLQKQSQTFCIDGRIITKQSETFL